MKKIKKYLLLLLAFVCAGLIGGCQDDIDMSDRYTFTEETVTSYLQKHAQYSEYTRLLGEVHISQRSTSTVLQMMSARGHYTVFAPDNNAIQEYLDSLCSQGLIETPSWEGFNGKDPAVLDSIRKVIVFNSIIDTGDEENATVYETSAFPLPDQEFAYANMNERKLIYHKQGIDSMFIGGLVDKATQRVVGGAYIDNINHDIYASNGYIHQVHSVIAPSNETVADVMKQFIEQSDSSYILTAEMLQACGLFDTLSKVKDEVYEQMYLNGDKITNLVGHNSFNNHSPGYMPEHRKYGFTIFAETKAFWETALGKRLEDITLDDLQNYAQGFYPDATDEDYKSVNNALNRFISYHILPYKLSVDKLVIHHNEKGYNFNTSGTRYTIPVWEYYTTMGERRLLKIYQGAKDEAQSIYLNRFPVLNNGRHDNYHESDSVALDGTHAGFKVLTEEARDVLNGYIYPIENAYNTPLVYDDNIASNFMRERIRMDVSSFFPELTNNDIRNSKSKNKEDLCIGIPCDKVYHYCEGINIEEGTNFYFLSGYGWNWWNYQGDEFNVTGRYEMTMKLPPVPKRGTYEIRYCVQTNTAERGMCQVYFGENKEALPAIGIPLDLRMGGQTRRTAAGNFASIVGWELDDPKDDDANAEVDKKMRNNGFMKGAEYYCQIGNSNTARAMEYVTRRIIVCQDMDPKKTYYLKFKSVLEDEKKEFYMDYLEYCAKEVYDNPAKPEDIW